MQAITIERDRILREFATLVAVDAVNDEFISDEAISDIAEHYAHELPTPTYPEAVGCIRETILVQQGIDLDELMETVAAEFDILTGIPLTNRA